MSIYGKPLSYCNESVSLDECTELSIDEALELQSSIIESLIELNESNNYEEIMDLHEGANLDYRKAFKDAKKEYKEAHSEFRKAIAKEDYTKAKSCTKKMDSALDKCEKTIKSIDSSIGSDIFGYFAAELLVMAELFIPSLATTTGAKIAFTGVLSSNAKKILIGTLGTTAGYVITLIKDINIFIKMIKQIIEDIKNDAGAKNTANLYRNKLLTCIKDMRKKVKKLNILIEKKEKMNK